MRTAPSSGVTFTFLTSAGGVGGGGITSGGVPAGGCGRTISVTSLNVALPAPSRAPKVIVRLPTGRKAGALVVTTGLGSTMSVADAAERKETTPDTVFGTPVGVVAYTDRAAGTMRLGGVVSRTVTLNVACRVLPRLSLALQL